MKKSVIVNLILILVTAVIIAGMFLFANKVSRNLLDEKIEPDAETIEQVKAAQEEREAENPVQVQSTTQTETAETEQPVTQELETDAIAQTNEEKPISAEAEAEPSGTAEFVKGCYPNQDTYMYLDYYVYLPSDYTADMPLVVFMHGDGYISSLDELKHCGIVDQINKIYGEDFPFVLLLPCTREASWSGWITDVLKELIDNVAQEYSIDMDRIIVTGHSRGAIGTWDIVSDYGDYFAAAVPVSGATDITTESFVNVPVWAICGECIDDYDTYYDWMKYQCDKIQNAGGEAKITIITDANHTDTESQAYTADVFEWMLSQ